jgi:hypothetical protein
MVTLCPLHSNVAVAVSELQAETVQAAPSAPARPNTIDTSQALGTVSTIVTSQALRTVITVSTSQALRTVNTIGTSQALRTVNTIGTNRANCD